LLLNINIINFKHIIVNVNKRKLIIKSYRNLKTKLEIKLKNNIRVKQIVKIEKKFVIVAYFVFEILVIIRNEILLNKNYFFKSILFDAYFYIVNKKIFFVYVRNNRSMSFRISQYTTLKRLLEFKKQNYY